MYHPYAPYDSKLSVPPPQPSLNGGLYTGEPFAKNAPWANVPVVPEGTYMTHVNLRSANPPPGAIYQYAGGIRPGNNYQIMPGVQKVSDKYNMWCNNAPRTVSEDCTCNTCRFRKYSYV
jgi:hypothetical protein